MYINAFMCAVPDEKREAYLEHSTTFSRIIKEYGARRYVECWGADVPDGELTSFVKAVRAEPGETVVIGWGEWPDKETCDAAMEKVMQDERMPGLDMPFDGKRLIFGGFESILEV